MSNLESGFGMRDLCSGFGVSSVKCDVSAAK